MYWPRNDATTHKDSNAMGAVQDLSFPISVFFLIGAFELSYKDVHHHHEGKALQTPNLFSLYWQIVYFLIVLTSSHMVLRNVLNFIDGVYLVAAVLVQLLLYCYTHKLFSSCVFVFLWRIVWNHQTFHQPAAQHSALSSYSIVVYGATTLYGVC